MQADESLRGLQLGLVEERKKAQNLRRPPAFCGVEKMLTPRRPALEFALAMWHHREKRAETEAVLIAQARLIRLASLGLQQVPPLNLKLKLDLRSATVVEGLNP